MRVLVAGARAGGLEAVLALRELAPAAAITLLTPERHFIAPGVRIELARIAADRAFTLVRDALDRIDPAHRRAITQEGVTLTYDALVLALGACALALPGGVATPALPGLPHDDAGLTPVDDRSRVLGLDGVYAIGGLAAAPHPAAAGSEQRARAAAASIALAHPARRR